MKLSLFMEIPVPRPWSAKAFNEALDLGEAADEADLHQVWVTEHDFMGEFCHAMAPGVFLAATSQRTRNIRLGHGVLQTPPRINHRLRTAERLSTLGCISGGRVDFGAGEASSVAELEDFRVDPATKRAVEAWARDHPPCDDRDPLHRRRRQFVKAPARNVVPKTYHDPHPLGVGGLPGVRGRWSPGQHVLERAHPRQHRHPGRLAGHRCAEPLDEGCRGMG